MSTLTNILINLYGESFREDFEEHLALLKEINVYYRRKRIDIEQQSKSDFLCLAKTLRHKYKDICCYSDDKYSEWFNEVFIKDYDNALIEVEKQDIPFDRELCILRIAREAKYKRVSFETIHRFCREYLVDGKEYTMFWYEYLITNNYE